jgi:Cys-tRNA(Pro)/Cys-tRNA(Cys) deacylase
MAPKWQRCLQQAEMMFSKGLFMTTRAISFLKKKKIPFEYLVYDHLEKGAQFASQALNFSLEKTIKTLVIDIGNRKYALVLLPGDKKASMKKIAKACSVKRVAMADAETAQRVTGYKVGGISPFGTQKRLPVVMENRLLKFQKVIINGGRRGVMLAMNPEAVLEASGGQTAPLCRE